MTDYLNINLSEGEIRGLSNLGLAHIGDCVYELMVRSMIIASGRSTSAGLHRETVKHVSAPAQAAAVEKILHLLNDEERDVYRRGRNTRVNSVPKNADISQYHAATGLEALFGWLYLKGRRERLNELFAVIMEEE
ncbi:MAG: ribonuclease III [Clostridia bacterium]|nr:ribonuclease III [Oscillospiraceae bacterium]MBQ9733034.1 ribonuclease III [Clostridia bacterium]